MRKWKILLVALFAIAFASTAFAAGNKNDLAYLSLDELESATSVALTDEVIIATSSVPQQGITVAEILGRGNEEVKVTTDEEAVLAAESGKTFIATLGTKFQLPVAAAGLSYTFVSGASIELQVQTATSAGAIVFQDADGNNNAVIETSNNTTGDSVTLVSDGTSWYISKSTGDWATGGAWATLNTGA